MVGKYRRNMLVATLASRETLAVVTPWSPCYVKQYRAASNRRVHLLSGYVAGNECGWEGVTVANSKQLFIKILGEKQRAAGCLIPLPFNHLLPHA